MGATAHGSGRTVVFQAWVGRRPPAFVERCLASTAGWARSRGFEYRLLGDDFLDVLPEWYRERLGSHIVQQTNLARMRYARDVLAAGADRAIWIDADVVVYAPDDLVLDAPDGFALCREAWIQPAHEHHACIYGVNQSVVVADRGNPLLDYLVWAHETLVRDRPQNVRPFGTATALLAAVHEATPLPLVTGIAMMNPTMLREIASGEGGPVTREYVRRHGYPTQAANLTLSMLGTTYDGGSASEDDYDAAVEVLLATRGAPLDLARAYAPAAPSAQSRGTR
ncbi:MAG TPA: hypothetical protein VFQ55_17250 [Casimicrobiaceae bacterium]|nr:hypothetical protein [Casimicrobiaceae bacterium]